MLKAPDCSVPAGCYSVNLNVDTGYCDVLQADKFLICSDGLTNMVDNEELKNICYDSNIKDKAQHLVQRAINYGGKDNITCIVVEIS